MESKSLPSHLNHEQIQLIHDLIDKVAERQLQDFGKINSDIKSDGTLITECDKWSDHTIVKGIEQVTHNKEGVLSEEGSKSVPISSAFWVVDPLDGTTNFSAGIPFWSISIARFVNGTPDIAFLDIPALKRRIIAIQGKGVWINQKKIFNNNNPSLENNNCISLCSRSIKILQFKPNKSFPGKIRLLGVSSLNMTSVALGQTIGAIEATPKIWDLAAAWLILSELGCFIDWLETNPKDIKPEEDLGSKNFPLLAASSQDTIKNLKPWATLLIEK